MKILVLTVTAGQGHNTCAKAVIAALEKRGVDCSLVDTVKYISEMTGDALDRAYLNMSKYTPQVWGSLYRGSLRSSRSISEHSGPGIIPMVPKKFRQLISAYAPDGIVCTHFFASLLLTRLRSQGSAQMPVIGINTDFSLHPFWEAVNQDHLVLASDAMDYMVHQRGIHKESILPIGIPVHEKFRDIPDKQACRQALNLTDKPTLLIMSGSMGFGSLLDHVDELDTLPLDFQMTVICGNNLALKGALEEKINAGAYRKYIRPLGFIDNVQLYMGAADLICTKPGGLSVSETFCVGRPMVLLDPIPGLEELNAAFLVNNGLAVQTSKNYSLNEAVYNLFANPRRMQAIEEEQRRNSPRDAADKLSDFLLESAAKYQATAPPPPAKAAPSLWRRAVNANRFASINIKADLGKIYIKQRKQTKSKTRRGKNEV